MFENKKWHKLLPPETEEVCEDNLRLFFETMYERQCVWKRRSIDQLPRPWTEDIILRDYKFTNIYRELDKNSQWLIHNIIIDTTLDLRNLVWEMMVFRFFNNIPTFTFNPQLHSKTKDCRNKSLKFVLPHITGVNDMIPSSKWSNSIPNYEEYDEDEFAYFIAGVRSVGINPHTSSYFINPGEQDSSRDYTYVHSVIPTLHKNMDAIITKVQKAKTPEDIFQFLQTLPQTGEFIAHEFYQDFTYIPMYTDRKFMKFDQNDFTNVGPGCSVGLRLIFPNLTKKEQKDGIYILRDASECWLNIIAEERGEEMPYVKWDKTDKSYKVVNYNITLHQIEMWLCEFQKYWKMTIGEGKQRGKYMPK